ncbi:MAG: chemotaxis protein CheR [Deltaproteobacteria bacterium]|nr:chemotaxis protein CheR [Deltaproteobacteria bacterium]
MTASALRNRIQAQLGIMMPETKEALVRSRLQRRLAALGVDSLEAYERYLATSPAALEELRELVSAITTNTTSFFREAPQIDYLVEQIVPSILATERYATVKVWSAGCSSGEEPYSIAMALADLQRRVPGWDYAILATDVSPRVLDAARTGVYLADQAAAIPRPLHRYLMTSRDPERPLVRVRPELRAKIAFHELNFMDPRYAVDDVFDVIYFRNVAIYFDPPTQDAVVTRLCRHLRPGGHLMIGHSESLVGRDVPVRHVAPSIYRKPARGRTRPIRVHRVTAEQERA